VADSYSAIHQLLQKHPHQALANEPRAGLRLKLEKTLATEYSWRIEQHDSLNGGIEARIQIHLAGANQALPGL